MLVTFGICFKQHFDTRYLVFYNASPPRMFLSLDLLWEYRIQHGANGLLYVTKFQIYKQNYEFKFFENMISETNEYNYLGITFSTENFERITNGSKKKHSEQFMPQEI